MRGICTVRDSNPGTKFDEVLELYIVCIAELMSCFTKKKVKNPKFPILSSEVKRLKETEGGVSAVCEVMQRYEKIAVDEAMHTERMAKIKKMIQKGYSKEEILDLDYSEDEYVEAEQELQQSS